MDNIDNNTSNNNNNDSNNNKVKQCRTKIICWESTGKLAALFTYSELSTEPINKYDKVKIMIFDNVEGVKFGSVENLVDTYFLSKKFGRGIIKHKR